VPQIWREPKIIRRASRKDREKKKRLTNRNNGLYLSPYVCERIIETVNRLYMTVESEQKKHHKKPKTTGYPCQ